MDAKVSVFTIKQMTMSICILCGRLCDPFTSIKICSWIGKHTSQLFTMRWDYKTCWIRTFWSTTKWLPWSLITHRKKVYLLNKSTHTFCKAVDPMHLLWLGILTTKSKNGALEGHHIQGMNCHVLVRASPWIWSDILDLSMSWVACSMMSLKPSWACLTIYMLQQHNQQQQPYCMAYCHIHIHTTSQLTSEWQQLF